jgi:HAD superfamily hydrolase (TIGR01509 family)
VRAVIFDVDGTLLDSEENYYLADQRLLELHGIPFTREDKRRYIGGGNRDMMADLKKRFGLSDTVEALVDRKNELYLEIAATATAVYPEMLRFLRLVRQAGLPTAAASGSSPPVLDRVLSLGGLEALLDVVVSAEEVARGKPAPDVFLEAARRLGVSPQECLVVEDSRHGVEAARRASMRCIVVPYLVEHPTPEGFLAAGLLFERGMAQFDADEALAWMNRLQVAAGTPPRVD